VVVFAAVTCKYKLKEAFAALEMAEANVVGAVGFGGAALLDLLEVAQAGLGVAFAHGDGGIAKVEQHFAAMQVVTPQGQLRVSLGRVGKHQYAEAMAYFKLVELLHEGQGGGGAFDAPAQEGDVIDNDHGGAGFFHGGSDGERYVLHKVFVAGSELVQYIVLGAVKTLREAVATVAVGIALLKLCGGQLKIEIKDGLRRHTQAKRPDGYTATEAIGQLHSEQAFAHVGIGKERTKFALQPEIAKEGLGAGGLAGAFQPVISRMDVEEVVGEGGVGDGLICNRLWRRG